MVNRTLRLLVAVTAAAVAFHTAPARAQIIPDIPQQATPGEKLLLEADQLIYDTTTGSATALGNVFIHYQGYQVFASEVTYDQSTNTLTARRGVRFEEPGGNIVIAKNLTLSDDLRDGFLTGLRADTIYRTRIGANRAERIDGNVIIFEDAGYTACWSCRRRPDKPATWVIKARRIVADEEAKTLRFEGAKFEAFGVSSPTLPSFTIPDPRIRRKSGVLIPGIVYSNRLGLGARAAYFQTLGPSRDITYGITPLSRQGVFGDVEYRERTASGFYSLRTTGIYQLDPGAFDNSSGDRRFRGSISTEGNFYLNPRWQWGWDSTITTDRRYLDDYKQSAGDNFSAPSTLYLTGLGERNYFDARLWAFRILQEDYVSEEVLDPPPPFSGVGDNLQGKQAVVHPVIDYEGVFDGAVLGGEFSYAFNTTVLSRQETDAFGAFQNGLLTARFRGVEGTFARSSAQVGWRKRIMAPLGQVITPYAGARVDVFYTDNRDPNVDALTRDDVAARAMPYAGIGYRYPWLIASGWGTQTIEPIAEIFARPNETGIGEFANEDAQSIVFDDTNLFGPTKFSGYDRVEGGVRANVGVRYTLQSYSGGFLSMTLGQSYHLAGRNSYRIPDILDSTGNSGLTDDRSDYVGDVTLSSNGGLTVSANGRFDDDTLDLERAEVSASARSGPLSSRIVYAFLAAQPDLGIVDEREEVQTAASLRVFPRMRLFGQLRYDIQNRDLVSGGAGVAYDDDALSVSLAYSEERDGVINDEVDRTLFFRFGLRTIGDGTGALTFD